MIITTITTITTTITTNLVSNEFLHPTSKQSMLVPAPYPTGFAMMMRFPILRWYSSNTLNLVLFLAKEAHSQLWNPILVSKCPSSGLFNVSAFFALRSASQLMTNELSMLISKIAASPSTTQWFPVLMRSKLTMSCSLPLIASPVLTTCLFPFMLRS